MSNKQTLEFTPVGAAKAVKWSVMSSQEANANLLAYRLVGLIGTLDNATFGSLILQALEAVGAGDKYDLVADESQATCNDYGKWVSCGWQVTRHGYEALHSVTLTLMFPVGWQVQVNEKAWSHDPVEQRLAADFASALSLIVVGEVNAGQLPPVESAFTAPEHFPHDSDGKPVLLPAEPPAPGDRLLTQEDIEARELAQKKAEAEALGFKVDE